MAQEWPAYSIIIGEPGYKSPGRWVGRAQAPQKCSGCPWWEWERSCARGNPAQAVKDWLLAEGLGGQPGLHLNLHPTQHSLPLFLSASDLV